MKNFFKKYGFAFFALIIICIVITINFSLLTSSINRQIENQFADNTDYKLGGKLVASSDKKMENTPVSAIISGGKLIVEAELKNSTGKKLKLKDFAVLTFGGYEFPSDVKFDGDGTLNSGSTLKVTYETNISVFKRISIMPTTMKVDLGAYDSNNNYNEYDLKYYISWY